MTPTEGFGPMAFRIAFLALFVCVGCEKPVPSVPKSPEMVKWEGTYKLTSDGHAAQSSGLLTRQVAELKPALDRMKEAEKANDGELVRQLQIWIDRKLNDHQLEDAKLKHEQDDRMIRVMAAKPKS